MFELPRITPQVRSKLVDGLVDTSAYYYLVEEESKARDRTEQLKDICMIRGLKSSKISGSKPSIPTVCEDPLKSKIFLGRLKVNDSSMGIWGYP